jgi:hypothetical protein
MSIAPTDLRRNDLPLAYLEQCPFRLLPPGLIELWSINSSESNPALLYDDRVTVDDVTSSTDRCARANPGEVWFTSGPPLRLSPADEKSCKYEP